MTWFSDDFFGSLFQITIDATKGIRQSLLSIISTKIATQPAEFWIIYSSLFVGEILWEVIWLPISNAGQLTHMIRANGQLRYLTLLLSVFVYDTMISRYVSNSIFQWSSGITCHHLRNNEVASRLEDYEYILERILLPLMKQSLKVNPHQQIIWVHQSPTNDYVGPSFTESSLTVAIVNNEKIQHYNQSIRRILR